MFVLDEELTQQITAMLEDEPVLRAGFANRELWCDVDDDLTV